MSNIRCQALAILIIRFIIFKTSKQTKSNDYETQIFVIIQRVYRYFILCL